MTFLIARPQDKADLTLAEFARHGLRAQVLPLIEINVSKDAALLQTLQEAEPSAIIITSSYAAQWLVSAITKSSVKLELSQISIICVGKTTAQCIAPYANPNQITIAVPENSEGILQLECLQSLHDQNIVLLKGRGGRDLIPKILQKRKATVTVLDVYERVANIGAINAFAFEPSQIRCIIVTSIEIAELLISKVDRTWLESCQWIVASERIRNHVCAKGIKHISVSQGASNKALLDSANQLVNTGVLND